MSGKIDEQAAYDAVVDAVELVCGFPRAELGPDLPIDNLGIDSLSASEIVQEVETALGIEADVKTIAGQWSSHTLGSLAKMFLTPGGATHGL
uniref:Carrier domain-containing protein n=1 Tax=uncultured bacterium esnapd14 TaxID=1366594 RepID=S5UBE4_9BACT|nr:hypothetical protein [uncultured bacterium esnapd14]